MQDTIHTARAHAQDAIQYAAWLMPRHQTIDGRESCFVSERNMDRAFARSRMWEKLALAGITVAGFAPARVVDAIDAWGKAQGWDCFHDRPLA